MKAQTARIAIAMGLFVTATPQALAIDGCKFLDTGSTLKLMADCTTDATILIPDGYTLNGNNHKITAVDPPGGHFLGAVVKNAGTTANVLNLTIDTVIDPEADPIVGLADHCDTGADRLRGILFDGASGTIRRNKVLNINQYNPPSGSPERSVCQEGNAIEVRNPPFDNVHPNTQTVQITNNTIGEYQKTGIVANGDVYVVVNRNDIMRSLTPNSPIAPNGIQFAFGALGQVRSNTIESNALFTTFIDVLPVPTTAASGILVFEAGENALVARNKLKNNDVGIWVLKTSLGKFFSNKVEGAPISVDWPQGIGLAGIALDDFGTGLVVDNKVRGNSVKYNDWGIGLFGQNVINNEIRSNNTTKNREAGIFADLGTALESINFFIANMSRSNIGDGMNISGTGNFIQNGTYSNNEGHGLVINGEANLIKANIALNNVDTDIVNESGDNDYEKNKCGTSSGPPVDCGISVLVPVRGFNAIPRSLSFQKTDHLSIPPMPEPFE